MIISYLRSNSRRLATLLPIWATLLYFRLFLWPIEANLVAENSQMPLFSAILTLIPVSNYLVTSALTMALIFIELVLINQLVNRYFMLEQRSLLPSYIYVLITAFSATLFTFNAVHFGVIFFLLALKHLVIIMKAQDVRSHFFNIGFYLAIGSLFYIGLIPVFIAFLIGLLFAYPYDNRLWIISLLGFLMPFVFYFSMLFLLDLNISQALSNIVGDFLSAHAYKKFEIPTYFFLGLLTLLLLIAGIRQYKLLSSRNVVSRRLFLSLFIITVTSVVLVVLIPGIAIEFLFIAAVPVALLFADFVLLLQSKLFEDTVFILLLAFSIFVSIVG